jgi:hypothetical protein
MNIRDAVDSYFKFVKARIVAKNPKRTVMGVIEANAWPPKNVQAEAFYLLLLGEMPTSGTATSIGFSHLTQWVWTIEGADLPQDQVGNNRGSRYQSNYQMKSELINGLYPYFCDKNVYTPQVQGNKLVAVPTVQPQDSIWWSRPRFMPTRFEKQEGIIYGACQVTVGEFADVITS